VDLFSCLQPSSPPAERIWGDLEVPGVLRKKSWELQKRKRNLILSLKSHGLHTHTFQTLSPVSTPTENDGKVYSQIHKNTFPHQINSDS
jgi:hypothetical protein